MKIKTTIKSIALASLMMFGSSLNAQQGNGVILKGLAAESVDLLFSATSQSQQDLSKLPKMERDIIILQNVLNDLFRDSKGGIFYSRESAKGIYIKEKGVVFNINDAHPSEILFINSQTKNDEKVVEKNDEQMKEEKEARLKSLSQEFLINYGSILYDLKGNEKVILNINYSNPITTETKNGQNGNLAYFNTRGQSQNERMMSSASAESINGYLTGKLSESGLKGKITTSITSGNDTQANDTKIMAGILDDVFKSTFDGSFKQGSKTTWTYFDGFGLIYEMNFSPSLIRVVKGYYAGEKIDTSAEEEENAKKLEVAEANFEKLVDLAKESLVTYGRTLRTVKSDEVVILNMSFGNSFGKVELPKAVRIQVTKSQIESFSKGSISLDQLKKNIEVTKLTSSASFSGNDTVHFPASHNNLTHSEEALRISGTIKSASFPKNNN
jgi:hypothetical protein